ncbi:MAG: 3-deoxy-manno-octulosonate cytidylyltransferase [bacterium]|nr:3-deoxy-manno-octulosonate cytidylyltransferase [bacterium]
MKQIIVIPARMKGTRLPGKPLIEINGKAIIYHVWDRCRQIHPENNIYIATEDEEIKTYCANNGINCVNTGTANTAIDRIKLFSDTIIADAYINIQGDEPIANLNDIQTILNYNRKYPDRVVFGKTSCSETEFDDYSKAKVVCNPEGRLLYSSRAGIPVNNKGKFVSAERAIWLYAFSKYALDQYYLSAQLTTLDKVEDNEIIRFLEIDLPVYCVNVIGDSWSVDEPKDLEIVKQKMDKQNINP